MSYNLSLTVIAATKYDTDHEILIAADERIFCAVFM